MNIAEFQESLQERLDSVAQVLDENLHGLRRDSPEAYYRWRGQWSLLQELVEEANMIDV